MEGVPTPMVYGRQSVREALIGSLGVAEVWIASGVSWKGEIMQLAEKSGTTVREVGVDEIQRCVPSGNHQGVVGFLRDNDFAYSDLDEILAMAERLQQKPLVAILDEITDSHNLGAIIRSAECAGVHGIILPRHRSADINATVLKTSAGAAVHMRIAQVTNLVHAMEELKEKGLWIYGSDSTASVTCFDTDLTGPVGLVIGSEGKGMRRLVAEHCDVTLRIPMYGKVNSLNASVAAGILFYETIRQRNSRRDQS